MRGSISAGAEEPRPEWPPPARRWVYLRGAEEPPCRGHPSCLTGIYLRGCGGTHSTSAAPQTGQGLSPRVRRNRLERRLKLRDDGSISAGAEEPRETARRFVPAGVYLRGCGGTSFPRLVTVYVPGLSPRVRRNLNHLPVSKRLTGSISAGAEEPCVRSPAGRLPWVYLRGCGGTRSNRPSLISARGLSPRVRRNLDQRPAQRSPVGSISAGAEEPLRRSGRGRKFGVYLRGCGGTRKPPFSRAPSQGLSPRVRRNLWHLNC